VKSTPLGSESDYLLKRRSLVIMTIVETLSASSCGDAIMGHGVGVDRLERQVRVQPVSCKKGLSSLTFPWAVLMRARSHQ